MGLETDRLENIEDTEILDISGHIDSIQIRSLIQPNTINQEVWDSIPDKIEEADIDGDDLRWNDSRENLPYDKKFFQRIRNHGSRLYEKRSLVEEINLLEDAGWQKCSGDVCVPVTEGQKAELSEARETLQKQITEYEKSQEQFEALAVTLRMTKTANNILGTIGGKDGSEHIEENFTQKYIQALEEAPNLIEKMKILNDLKFQISDLLNDFYELQVNTLSKFENVKDEFDQSNQALIENYVSRIFDKLVQEFGQSFGDYLIEGYNPPNVQNPLGVIPNEDLSNLSQNLNLKEGYEQLNELFADVYNGNSKLNFETLKPIVAQIQEPLNQDEMSDSIDPESFGSRLQEYNNAEDFIFEMHDERYNIVKYTKEAFDGFFSNETKKDNLGIQIGFVPFASTSQNQNIIELILSSPKYSGLFNLPPTEEVDTPQGSVTVQWTPALLSRIMFLYNRYSDSMKEETQSQLNEVEMI